MKHKNIEDLTWEVIRITGEMKPKVVICEKCKRFDYGVCVRTFTKNGK